MQVWEMKCCIFCLKLNFLFVQNDLVLFNQLFMCKGLCKGNLASMFATPLFVSFVFNWLEVKETWADSHLPSAVLAHIVQERAHGGWAQPSGQKLKKDKGCIWILEERHDDQDLCGGWPRAKPPNVTLNTSHHWTSGWPLPMRERKVFYACIYVCVS